MGGDRGPEEIVAGAVEAASATVQPVIVGPRGLDTGGLELIEAPDVIAMDDKPTEAVRAKPNSSLVVACRAVGERKADAVVSAGNTGAMLAACLLELRRIPGVRRPAIAVTIPARRGPSVLLDSGANADARPEDLVQFAHMGAVFAAGDPRCCQSGDSAGLDRRGAGEGKPVDARGTRSSLPPPQTSTSPGTPRAETCLPGRPTSSSPTASRATSRSRSPRERSWACSRGSAPRSRRPRWGSSAAC